MEECEFNQTIKGYGFYRQESKPLANIIIVTFIYTLIIILTVLGNLAVILAYHRDYKLRRSVSNIFIVNLAVVGLVIGACLLTVNCIWLVTDDWVFGEYPCKVWLVWDYSTSYMLVVSMIYISLDRLQQISQGMSYFESQTASKATVMIFTAWIVTFVYYSIVIFGWSHFVGRSVIDYSVNCEMETMCSPKYNVGMVFIEFLIPLCVLVFLNMRVFREIRLRAKGVLLPEAKHEQVSEGDIMTESESKLIDHDDSKPKGENKNDSTKQSEVPLKYTSQDRRRTQMGIVHRRKEAKHCLKAGLTLAILVGVFVICWLPVTLLTFIFAYLDIPEIWWEVASNLLWCNATLNPILYALTNARFRNAFSQFTFVKTVRYSIRSMEA